MRVMRSNLDGSHIETLVEAGRGDPSNGCVGITVGADRGHILLDAKKVRTMANAGASSAPISGFSRARTPLIAETLPSCSTDCRNRLIWARPKKSPSGFSVKPMRRKDRLTISYLVVPLHIHVVFPVLPVDDSNGYNFCRHDRLRRTFSEIIVDRLYDVRGAFT